MPAKVTSVLLPMGNHLGKLKICCWEGILRGYVREQIAPGKEFSINSGHVAIMQLKQFVVTHPLLNVI